MPISQEIQSGVAILQIDSPPVNAFGGAVRAALASALDAANRDDAVEAIVLRGTHLFSAGADINEFGGDQVRQLPMLWDLFDLIDDSAKPVVAAVDGIALGGGLECILAADARIATPRATFGLPEVKLGILPGAGGTQRLTRLVGPAAAIELMVQGDPVDAETARGLGILDAISDDLVEAAVALARQIVLPGRRPTSALQRRDRTTGAGPDFFSAERARVVASARGADAPAAIVACVEAACQLDPADGLHFERERLHELQARPQHAALTYLFRAERTAWKIPGIAAAPRTISRMAVVGAGTMGTGIAMAFANAGIEVMLAEINADALKTGLGAIDQTYERSVSRRRMAASDARAARGRIRSTGKLADLADVELVIEAIPEDMAIKKRLFATLDQITSETTILATNTSSLDIDEIASATFRRPRVVGMHFFAPAHVMKLLENVRGSETDAETIATVMALAKRIGKIAVLAGNCDGFIGNRMLQYYTGAAEFMVEAGIAPERIDAVAERFGMPMGPLALRDLSGLDVAVLIRKERRSKLPPGARMSTIVEALHSEGRLGAKNGRGFYRYEGRRRIADPAFTAIRDALAARESVAQETLTDEQILDRLLLPLVNEGAREVGDGTAIRESDIDVAWVNGYGFPRHEGGPMFWGRRVGAARVRAMATELAELYGSPWSPAPNLEALLGPG
jgi:3-hydroxyacyl-CoA dehydrogenase